MEILAFILGILVGVVGLAVIAVWANRPRTTVIRERQTPSAPTQNSTEPINEQVHAILKRR